jgi:hypothetical protein
MTEDQKINRDERIAIMLEASVDYEYAVKYCNSKHELYGYEGINENGVHN